MENNKKPSAFEMARRAAENAQKEKTNSADPAQDALSAHIKAAQAQGGQNNTNGNHSKLSNFFFGNVGKKIQILAAIVLCLGSLAGLVGAIVWFSRSYFLVELGFLFLIGGPLVSWMLALLIYGFGVTVEKQVSIDRKLDNLQSGKK